MLKFMSLMMLFSLLTACEKEPQLPLPSVAATAAGTSAPAQDNFDDLKKKKDESCGTKEDAEKKIMEAAQKPAAFQGATDGDCTVK